MKRNRLIIACMTSLLLTTGAWAGEFSATARGARVQTDRMAMEIRDGIVVSIINRLTGEEYIDGATDLGRIASHLPAGLGTQATEAERVSALTLYKWPWWEHAADATWPTHHAPSRQSKCEFKAKDTGGASVAYKGLTDGDKAYDDESLTLDMAVDAETGDLLITPVAHSPRGGVYASSLAIAPLGAAITAEAPIFDGVRLDRHMRPALWNTQWGGYWDYAFLAFNGYKRGAVAVWCQDAELKYHKSLSYLINSEGLSFALTGFNVPPFESAKKASTVTWRVQAFDKGWSQAAARYRQWRERNLKLAARPVWASQISFVNGGVNADKQWTALLEQYLGGADPRHTITLGGGVRVEAVDSNHINNTPYAGFRDDMKLWKGKGYRMMPYMQTMVMQSPNAKTDREKAGLAAHTKADTITAFQKPADAKPIPYLDQHHLGQPDWQRWMLDWVREYIQDYGADGVYHDDAYPCPLDVRGLAINHMTTSQGMADYFLKAQTENPDALHSTEHLTEVNIVGASLGVGSSVVWGTAQSMRRQRIDHPSPISAALHDPLGVIFAYPHQSGVSGGPTERFHWEMNLAEGRSEIAFALLQNADAVRTRGLANERWLECTRNQLFLRHGLRPTFPEDWDRGVLSYFAGAKGEDYRYIKTDWGSALVETNNGKTATVYGRIHGTPAARCQGAIYGWPLYNASGPAGLHPDRYYVLDPNLKRPASYFSSASAFSPSLYEGYVEEGFAGDHFVYMKIRPRADILNITSFDSVVLHSPEPPKAIWVNGVDTKPAPLGNGQWKIDFQLTSQVAIVAIVSEITAGLDKLPTNVLARSVGEDWASDQLVAAEGGEGCTFTGGSLMSERPLIQIPIHVSPVMGDGLLRLVLPDGVSVEYNGMAMERRSNSEVPRKWLEEQGLIAGVSTVAIPLRLGEQGLISIRNHSDVRKMVVGYQWNPR